LQPPPPHPPTPPPPKTPPPPPPPPKWRVEHAPKSEIRSVLARFGQQCKLNTRHTGTINATPPESSPLFFLCRGPQYLLAPSKDFSQYIFMLGVCWIINLCSSVPVDSSLFFFSLTSDEGQIREDPPAPLPVKELSRYFAALRSPAQPIFPFLFPLPPPFTPSLLTNARPPLPSPVHSRNTLAELHQEAFVLDPGPVLPCKPLLHLLSFYDRLQAMRVIPNF